MDFTGTSTEDEHGVDALIRLTAESPGEISVVAIGPLTNIAMAAQASVEVRKIAPPVPRARRSSTEPRRRNGMRAVASSRIGEARTNVVPR